MKIQRGTLLLCATLVLLTSWTARAQERSAYAPIEGNWALQFSIGSNFSIGSFSGSMLSLKKQTSATSGWRLGAGLGGFIGNEEYGSVYGERDSSDDVFTGDVNSYSIDVNFEYMNYLTSMKDVHVYVAFGPRILYSYEETERSDDGGYRISRNIKDTYMEAGIIAHFGIEWFLLSQLSIHAEYGGFAGYMKDKYSNTAKGVAPKYDIDNKNVKGGGIFSSLGARFGLSVYF